MDTSRTPPTGEIDYAEPSSLGSARGREPRAELSLWGGRARRRLQWSCLALSLALATALVVALLAEQPGADSPEGAVEQLVQGLADLDGPAIVGVIVPVELADVGRADAAYRSLEARVLRVGEVPPVEVDRVLAAAEDQLGGEPSRRSLAVLAAVDLGLASLELDVERIDDRAARVYLLDGTLAVTVDPDRLPSEAVIDAGGSESAGYDMALAEGWQRDGADVVAYLVTVELDGRWYVSLEATADDLLDAT